MSKLTPTLDDMHVYCQVCDLLESNPAMPLQEASRRVKRSVSFVLRCIENLESRYKVTLIERTQRSGHKNVTHQGKELKERARRLLEEHSAFWHWPIEELVRVGTTNGILVNALPWGVADFMRRWGEKVRLRFREYDYPRIIEELKTDRIDLGIGPDLGDQVIEGIDFEPFDDLKIDMVLVAHPDHPFAARFAQGAEIDLGELATELVYLLPHGFQVVGWDRLPEPDAANGGNRIFVENYDSILALVSMGIGVGVVPAWYALLEDLRKQGQVVYSRMPSLGHARIAAYLRHGKRRNEVLNELIRCVRENLPVGRTTAERGDAPPRAKFPTTLEEFRFEYRVDCDANGVSTWRSGTARLGGKQTKKGTKVTGRICHERGELTLDEYEVDGLLLPGLAHWHGRRRGADADEHVAVFNAVVADPHCLVGTWTGRDRRGAPITAPVLLAREQLNPAGLQTIVRDAMQRIVLDPPLPPAPAQ